MLLLSRYADAAIVIDEKIIVKVIRVYGDQIELGIQAPKEINVHREEIQQ